MCSEFSRLYRGLAYNCKFMQESNESKRKNPVDTLRDNSLASQRRRDRTERREKTAREQQENRTATRRLKSLKHPN